MKCAKKEKYSWYYRFVRREELGDMEMLQLLLVNRGESLNTKHKGLFTYFYLADLLIDSLDAVYTRGLWELC